VTVIVEGWDHPVLDWRERYLQETGQAAPFFPVIAAEEQVIALPRRRLPEQNHHTVTIEEPDMDRYEREFREYLEKVDKGLILLDTRRAFGNKE